jgi:Ser/Thr protein kinase RdoA (MazF antagonist)
VHGDLHLQNVMLDNSGKDILIDFARASSGPVVVDIATLAADVLMRYPHLRHGLPKLGGDTLEVERMIQTFSTSTSWDQDDKNLFQLLVRVTLLRALGFSDTDETARTWIRGII